MRSSVTLLILGLVLAAGLTEILRLRVESKDLLPNYSSRSTDPKGLSALFEGLSATGAVKVSRSTRPPMLIKDTNATLLFAGVDLLNWTEAEKTIDEMERLANKGDRVVAALRRAPSRFDSDDLKQGGSLRTAWDVQVIAAPSAEHQQEDDEPVRWPAYFKAGPKWQVLHASKGNALIVERKFDAGSIVLIASTWPLTNEAMVQDRQSEVLAALFGAKPQVIFDESHLGLEEGGTVMALSREFHLLGFLMGLVLLACLFVWRNLASFPPDRAVAQRRMGRDSLSGLSILLARNIPTQNLIETCLAERQKSGEKRLRPDQIDRARATAADSKDVREGFEAIRKDLLKKRYL